MPGDLTVWIQDNGSQAWTNIPFAQPPVGDLRWKPPQLWQNGDGNPKMIVLDYESDGGVRMSSEEVTLESIKADFLEYNF